MQEHDLDNGIRNLRSFSLDRHEHAIQAMILAPQRRRRVPTLVASAVATYAVAIGLATMTGPASAAGQLSSSMKQPVDFAVLEATIQLTNRPPWTYTRIFYAKGATRQEHFTEAGKLSSVTVTQDGVAVRHDILKAKWTKKKSPMGIERFFHHSLLTEDLIAEAKVTKREGIAFKDRKWDEYLVENDKQWFKVYVDPNRQRVHFMDCFIKDHLDLPKRNSDKRRQLISIKYPSSLDTSLFQLRVPPGTKIKG